VNFTYYKNSGELPDLIAEKFPSLKFVASRMPQRLQFVTGVTGVHFPVDFNVSHIRELARIARPFALALISYAEYERFSAIADALDSPFEVYKTAESFLAVFKD
jgi:hypothetical protein